MTEELKENIDSITESLKSLENERVARLEAEIAKDEHKGSEEMFSNVLDRINKIEEDLAGSKGDDRVPSILTAIEALESKISQLEAGQFTNSGEESASEAEVEGIGTVKDDLNKFSMMFDKINIRLTEIEKRLNAISPPATVEGKSDSIEPPTT